ncbi:MAG: LCP family protein [Lachnospiraceae bacterium]|nr:LCP family protein [Lachnospiraceae bacterium]
MKNRPEGDAAVPSSIFCENRDIACVIDSRSESMTREEVTDMAHGGDSGKRKKHAALIGAGVLLVVLLVLAGGLAFAVNYVMGSIGEIEEVELLDPESEEFETDEDAGEDSIDPDEIEWAEDLEETEESEGITNILLIGQDTRVSGTRERSDSMILISINSDTDSVNMISFMRDLYVQIPGYSDNRINASYQFGGAELLDEVIEKNFGVTIDYNVEIDFDGFQDVIDLLGGVDITLTSTEASYFQNAGYSVSEGTNHVYGEFALLYARTRYVSTATEANDFGRTQRQRAVITSLFNAYKDVGITTQIALVDDILSLISTDMSMTQILSLLYDAQAMNLDELGSYRIPIDGSYTNQTIRGMQVLVPDLTVNREAVQEMIAGTYEE